MRAPEIAEAKRQARHAARLRRAAARAADADGQGERAANARLLDLLAPFRGHALAGYLPIRSEISPLAAMEDWAAGAPVCLPVVIGAAPLDFRAWTPGAALVEGAFGVAIPARGRPVEPDILIVPLLAFDREGGRLGYGGGHYDRTLASLRARRAVLAVGLAYSAQRSDHALRYEATDMALDRIVTEEAVIVPQGREIALAPRPGLA